MPDAKDLFERGERALEEKEYREACDCFTRCLQEEPRNVPALMHRIEAHLKLNDRPRALVDLNTAVRLEPEASDHLILRAALLAQQRQFEEAIADLNRAWELDPTLVTIPGRRALCHANAGNSSAALSDLEDAIRLDPENAERYRKHKRSILEQLADQHDL